MLAVKQKKKMFSYNLIMCEYTTLNVPQGVIIFCCLCIYVLLYVRFFPSYFCTLNLTLVT